ncbi:MAG: hypothetical protein FWE66_00975, partial [Oscillospiraceae bacterium]|nr:hypothetical protein [Oscillospiraceae bacterium]
MRVLVKKGGLLPFVLAFLLGSVFLFSLSAAIFLRLPLGEIALYFCFQLFAVILPGMTLVKLLRLRLTPLESLTLGYACGIASTIVVYFLCALLYLENLIPYAVCAAVLLALIVQFLLRGRPLRFIADRGEMKLALIFALFAASVTFVLLSATTLTPDVSGVRGYFHDLLNGVSLITSASNGFPMEFLQMAFTKHFYHPFFYGYCAVMKLCLGIDSFSIATNFSLISITPFFTCAFVCLAKKVISDQKLVALSSVLLYLLSYPMIYYSAVDLLGFPLGLGF